VQVTVVQEVGDQPEGQDRADGREDGHAGGQQLVARREGQADGHADGRAGQAGRRPGQRRPAGPPDCLGPADPAGREDQRNRHHRLPDGVAQGQRGHHQAGRHDLGQHRVGRDHHEPAPGHRDGRGPEPSEGHHHPGHGRDDAEPDQAGGEQGERGDQLRDLVRLPG